jgi:phage terminase large subunit
MLTSSLFSKIYNCDKRIIVLQGGGDSTKTSMALLYLAIDSIEHPKTRTTVTGQDLPNLKSGALRLFKDYYENAPEIAPFIKQFNKSESTYYFHNGSFIEFKGFEDEQDARGSERDNLFINECNSRPYNLFWQLQRKTRRKIILDYNPTGRFWVHDKLLGPEMEKSFKDQVRIFITDHRNNPFLRPEEHEMYENISDPELFKVYSRGLLGKIKGLIFGHFKPVDVMPDDCSEYIWAIDYGYTNDETAIVKIGIKGRQRYVELLAYEPGIQPERICEIIKGSGHKFELIYSEHDKAMISNLRKLGIPVQHARKGPGSVAAGISKVRSYECFYVANSEYSKQFKTELDTWKFMTAQDIQTGKEVITNIPIDGHDHACQASIYGIFTHSFRRLDA